MKYVSENCETKWLQKEIQPDRQRTKNYERNIIVLIIIIIRNRKRPKE